MKKTTLLMLLILSVMPMFATMPHSTPPRVVFMGNSITEGWLRIHPDFFYANSFVGKGISGQTSAQMLERFEKDVIALNPEYVVINAGTNDIAENGGEYVWQDTFDNIVAMTALARLHGIKVVLTSVLPAAAFPWRPEVKDASGKIQLLNERLRNFALERGIPYVDYYSAMVMPDGVTLNPSYSRDGVHPTSEGYDVMESLILPAL